MTPVCACMQVLSRAVASGVDAMLAYTTDFEKARGGGHRALARLEPRQRTAGPAPLAVNGNAQPCVAHALHTHINRLMRWCGWLRRTLAWCTAW